MSQSQYVRLEVADGLGTIRVDKPKMNPLDAEIQDAIAAASMECTERDDVSAVIVWGGERVFAAGADIKEMQQMSYVDMVRRCTALEAFATTVARIPKPTIAAVEGYALGAGCELAMACDFRVSARNAKWGQPEILLGLIPGAGGSQRLPRLVGPAKAKDLIFSGRFIDAQEAADIGLVDWICEPGQAYEFAKEKMSQYVGGPAVALRHAKEAIDRGLETDIDAGVAIEAMLFSGAFATDDARIGMTSFVEHGPGKATFTGR